MCIYVLNYISCLAGLSYKKSWQSSSTMDMKKKGGERRVKKKGWRLCGYIFHSVCKNLGNAPENLEKIAEGVGMGELSVILGVRRSCCIRSDLSGVETVFVGLWEKRNSSLSCLHEQGFQPGGVRSRGLGERRTWCQTPFFGRGEGSKLSPQAAEQCQEKRHGRGDGKERNPSGCKVRPVL